MNPVIWNLCKVCSQKLIRYFTWLEENRDFEGDGLIAILTLAVNIPLALAGGLDRQERRPWISVLAGIKGIIDGISYFFQMVFVEKKWCVYCIVGAIANTGIMLLTLSEVKDGVDEKIMLQLPS